MKLYYCKKYGSANTVLVFNDRNYSSSHGEVLLNNTANTIAIEVQTARDIELLMKEVEQYETFHIIFYINKVFVEYRLEDDWTHINTEIQI
jgi:hypothetical protein